MYRPDNFEQLLESLWLSRVVNEDKGVDPLDVAVGVFRVISSFRLILDDFLEFHLHLLGFFVSVWVCKQVWMVLGEGIQDLNRNKIWLWADVLCSVVVDLVLLNFFSFVILWIKVVVYKPIDNLCLANETRPQDTYSWNLHWFICFSRFLLCHIYQLAFLFYLIIFIFNIN